MKLPNFLAILLMVFALALLPASATTLWVGIEDLPVASSGTDKDYNDMIFSLVSQSTISLVGPGSWAPMVVPDANGTPFWDNGSGDGTNLNVGHFLTGTGGFAGHPNSPDIAVSDLMYYSLGGASVPSFLMFSPGDIGATIFIEVAGNANSNSLYWFDAATPGTLNAVFNGPQGSGAVASFNPGGDFGLALLGPGGTFRTSLEGGQFAVFSQVPEPSTYALMGLGLGLVGLARLRRRRTAEVS